MASLVLSGNTSGSVTISSPAVSGTTTLTLPTTTGTFALTAAPTFTGQATIPTINLTGGQITFPATQSASSDANTLDDYEEGTFTPGISTDGSPSTTYTTQTGQYTKIGNVVYIQIGIVWSAFSGTGNVVITGFPFAVPLVNPAKTISMPVISSTVAGLTNYSLSDFRTSGSFTNLYLYSFTGAVISTATIGSSGTITIKGFYFV